jgi:tetraacyldisaccharide 4'-kinase
VRVKGYDWSTLHSDRRNDPFRFFLAVLSHLYNGGVKTRFLAYRLGILRHRRLPAFVVSIGNLGVGGTGKTPAVRTLAGWALDQGYRPAVLSRGYGGSFRGKVLVVSDGTRIEPAPGASGDEPYLLAQMLSQVPVIVSRARYRGGLFACERFSSNFLILDDGFQHLELYRDLDIVLLDASDPFGNGFSLPRGPLREPIDQLRRADALVLTRSSREKKTDEVLAYLSRNFPETPVFLGDHVPGHIVFPVRGEKIDTQDLYDARVIAFAGIAHPKYFHETLEDLGVKVLAFKAFEDHHVYTPREIRALLEEREEQGARHILMTGKDWVKVQQTGVISPEMGYVDIQFRILEGADAFFHLVRDAFEKKET